MKKVSVIIPVYNSKKYLRNCLDSVLNQNYTDYEVILVDDESNDGSEVICDEYAQKYSNVCVIHQKNQGPGISRNNGLDSSDSEYYVFVDADDYVSPNYISGMVNIAEEKQADLVECGNVYMLETRNIFKGNDHKILFLTNHEAVQGQRKQYRNTVWGRLYRRKCFQHIHFNEKMMGEDADYSMQIISECNSMVRYNFCLYGYRSYQESITRKNISVKTVKNLKNLEANAAISKIDSMLDVIEHRGEYVLYRNVIRAMQEICDELKNNSDAEVLKLKERIKNFQSKCSTDFVHFITIYAKHYLVKLIVDIKILVNYQYQLKD